MTADYLGAVIERARRGQAEAVSLRPAPRPRRFSRLPGEDPVEPEGEDLQRVTASALAAPVTVPEGTDERRLFQAAQGTHREQVEVPPRRQTDLRPAAASRSRAEPAPGQRQPPQEGSALTAPRQAPSAIPAAAGTASAAKAAAAIAPSPPGSARAAVAAPGAVLAPRSERRSPAEPGPGVRPTGAALRPARGAAPRSVAAPRQATAPSRSPELPPLVVTIGRVEVRAVPAQPGPVAPRQAPRPGPATDLEEYLRGRGRR